MTFGSVPTKKKDERGGFIISFTFSFLNLMFESDSELFNGFAR